MKKALVVLFNNFEEMEAVAPVDILRRANLSVTTAAIGASKNVAGRNGVTLICDAIFDDASKEIFDAIIISGGPGVKDIVGNAQLAECVKRHFAEGKIVAAICAAPLVLHAAGVLDGKKRTAYPTAAEIIGDCDASQKVVRDSNVITSRGAGTATEFALALADALAGESVAKDVAKSICFIN